MKKWLFLLTPLLLLLIVPVDAQAERLLLTGSGEIQKRVSTSDTDLEIVFDAITTEKGRTVLQLESGFINVNNEKHFIHPQSEMRGFMNQQILRIAGSLDNNDLFLIYGLKDGTNYEMFGKLFTPENKFRVEYDASIKSLDAEPIAVKTDPNPTVEYTPTLGIDFTVEGVQFIQNDLTVILTAFDTKKEIGGIGSSVNNIDGVDIKVDLAQERVEYIVVNETTAFTQVVEDDWRIIKSIEGKTDKFGKWTGSQLLGSFDFQHDQWLQVTITATYGDQSVTETVKVFVSDAN